MKYRIKHCPNPDVVEIHVDQRLIHGTMLWISSLRYDSTKKDIEREAVNKEALMNFYEVVSELDGVEEKISFYRYEILISKADLFSWDKILPYVLDALKTFVAQEHELEEAEPPTHPSETLKALQHKC